MIPDDRIAEERTPENETAHNGQSWFVLSFLSSLLFFFNAPLVLLHGSLDQKTKVQELSAISYHQWISKKSQSNNCFQFFFSVHSWRTAYLVSVYTLTQTELQSDFSCTIHVRLHFLYLIMGRALLRKILHNQLFILCIIFRQQK